MLVFLLGQCILLIQPALWLHGSRITRVKNFQYICLIIDSRVIWGPAVQHTLINWNRLLRIMCSLWATHAVADNFHATSPQRPCYIPNLIYIAIRVSCWASMTTSGKAPHSCLLVLSWHSVFRKQHRHTQRSSWHAYAASCCSSYFLSSSTHKSVGIYHWNASTSTHAEVIPFRPGCGAVLWSIGGNSCTPNPVPLHPKHSYTLFKIPLLHLPETLLYCDPSRTIQRP